MDRRGAALREGTQCQAGPAHPAADGSGGCLRKNQISKRNLQLLANPHVSAGPRPAAQFPPGLECLRNSLLQVEVWRTGDGQQLVCDSALGATWGHLGG